MQKSFDFIFLSHIIPFIIPHFKSKNNFILSNVKHLKEEEN